MKMQLIGIILSLSLLTVLIEARADWPPDVEQKCQYVLDNVQGVSDADLLSYCGDFYWHNGEYDNYSYNNVIKISYRLIDLDQTDVENYTNVIWLLWSKYVSWEKDPTQMPDGEHKVDEALALARNGEKYNSKDGNYYLQIAMTIEGLVQFHRPDLGVFLIEYYQTARSLSNMNVPEQARAKLRAELNLGHYFYRLKAMSKALAWYKEALTTDPSNVVAQRKVKELEGSGLLFVRQAI